MPLPRLEGGGFHRESGRGRRLEAGGRRDSPCCRRIRRHADQALKEIVVQGNRSRDAAIHNLVAEAQTRLRDVELQYVFTGTGRNQVLRGRPVAFALWSEAKQEWCIALIELPRPPIKWEPSGKPLPFLTLTPDIQARHVEGTGAERLMFAFSRDGEPLKVYGRKFPVFDNDLIKHKQWSAVVQTAKPIVYLPFTEDTFDPVFVSSGKAFLLATAHQAIEDLRLAKVPSTAFRGELLADVIPPQLVTTLAVIEQTDDKDYIQKQALAFDDVLSQYGLKQEEAYRYSVSRANALGPMQFTNRKGHGTYAFVVRAATLAARLDPELRERRDQSAERHESGGLPAGSEPGGDAEGYSCRIPRQS